MEAKQAHIQLLPSQHNGIIISTDLCSELGINERKSIRVQLGGRSIWTRLLKSSRKDAQIQIPPTLKRELKIPFGGQRNVILEGDTLRIGPVVGVLTTGIQIQGNQLVSGRTPFFKHLLSAQKGEGLYYFLFTPSDVNWADKTVNGYFLTQINGVHQWQRALIPFPDVVYNRIPDRGTERAPGVLDFKQKLEKWTDAKMFNPTFFNKWIIHQQLVNHPTMGQHVPETYLSPSLAIIQTMLKKYRVVYLKPVGGSLGLGILKITYKPNSGYYCRYNNGTQNVLRRYNSLSALMSTHIPRPRLGRYLVQQGIPLITFEGRPLDFRVHVHKNAQNEWVVAALAAKVAGAGSVTTHVRTGGTVFPGQELLKQVYFHHSEYVAEQVKATATKLAEAIESRLNQNIGELGFDIGIDTNGNIWMFEANSRPGRSIFKHYNLKKEDQQSIHLILDYSRYLAKFN